MSNYRWLKLQVVDASHFAAVSRTFIIIIYVFLLLILYIRSIIIIITIIAIIIIRYSLIPTSGRILFPHAKYKEQQFLLF